jgi:hypothetical protein
MYSLQKPNFHLGSAVDSIELQVFRGAKRIFDNSLPENNMRR